jgi:hypothetical protein
MLPPPPALAAVASVSNSSSFGASSSAGGLRLRSDGDSLGMGGGSADTVATTAAVHHSLHSSSSADISLTAEQLVQARRHADYITNIPSHFCLCVSQHGTILRKTGWIVGMAIYTGTWIASFFIHYLDIVLHKIITGGDTKLSQNKSAPPTKVATTDNTINRFSVGIFSTQVLPYFRTLMENRISS